MSLWPINQGVRMNKAPIFPIIHSLKVYKVRLQSVVAKCGYKVRLQSVVAKCGCEVWLQSVVAKCGCKVWLQSVVAKCGCLVLFLPLHEVMNWYLTGT